MLKYSDDDADKIIYTCKLNNLVGDLLCYRCVDALLRAIHEITPENYQDILLTATAQEKMRGLE